MKLRNFFRLLAFDLEARLFRIDQQVGEVFTQIFHLSAMENRLMAKIDDSVARITASVNGVLEDISTEIQQLKDAVAANNGDNDDAIAAQLDALSDKVDAARTQLQSDDLAPETPPTDQGA